MVGSPGPGSTIPISGTTLFMERRLAALGGVSGIGLTREADDGGLREDETELRGANRKDFER